MKPSATKTTRSRREREVRDVVRGVDDGPVAAGQRAGGDHDVGLRFADSAGDDVQLAGGGVVLRERCEGATLAGEIDRAQRVECRAQLEGGEVIAERERRAAEGDDVVDVHLRAGVPAAIRHGPTWAHLDRVDNAPRRSR